LSELRRLHELAWRQDDCSLNARMRRTDDLYKAAAGSLPALLDIADAALARERALHVSGDRIHVLTAGDQLSAACKAVAP
jgi:hypothetical protein